ncbi:MAG: hydroxymethylglutaryl-CoA lyase [Aliihoeflea sp.]
MTRLRDVYPTDRVVLREVGLRDGLQLVKSFPSTAAKIEWIGREHAAGVRNFEVGSFLPASRFPQFADVHEVLSAVRALPSAHAVGLVLNDRGADDALAAKVDEIMCVVSATEAHSQANTRRSRAEAVAHVKRLCDLRDASDHRPLINAGIAMAFGCSITGAVDPQEVVDLALALFEAGADVVGLADTVGFAGPNQISALVGRTQAIAGDRAVAIHLHDTRGMAIANASAALDAGCRILDGSLGGVGGCPFAPGATGNVVFEDLVFLCETKGFATGIDVEKLVAIRDILSREMPAEPLYGQMARAGLPRVAELKAG